jgi:PPOX class probable F420-dependent enzyme
MDLTKALSFARSHHQGILMTLRSDGRPQSSNIAFGVGDDGIVRISVTDDRAKTRNLRRDPRASLHVNRADFYAYVVLEGDAELSAVAARPDDATVEELIEMYRALQGDHPDWNEFREAMVADRRLVVRLRPSRAYGMLPD